MRSEMLAQSVGVVCSVLNTRSALVNAVHSCGGAPLMCTCTLVPVGSRQRNRVAVRERTPVGGHPPIEAGLSQRGVFGRETIERLARLHRLFENDSVKPE